MIDKNDLINALSVMKTVMEKAGLVYEPAQLMIDALNKTDFYFESDLQRAFIAGWLVNYKTIDDIKDFDFKKAFDNYKTAYLTKLPQQLI